MLRIVKGLFLILMLDCHQSARLTSESFDRPLSQSEKWALKIHQSCCRSSHRVARQMQMMAEAIRECGSAERWMSADNLPDEARKRIRERLQQLRAGE